MKTEEKFLDRLQVNVAEAVFRVAKEAKSAHKKTGVTFQVAGGSMLTQDGQISARIVIVAGHRIYRFFHEPSAGNDAFFERAEAARDWTARMGFFFANPDSDEPGH